MRQTNADLKRYYRTANRLYFHNALPKDLPVRFAKLRGLGVTRVLNGSIPVVMEISGDLRRTSSLTILTVLHEMLHVEKPQHKGHDWRFDKRMLRLAKAGAFDGLW
jgi:hypothetical protein